MIANLPFIAVAVVALIGIVVILTRQNLVKMVMGLSLVEAAVNLFLVSLGYRNGGIAPIFTSAPAGEMAMPTVQAMTLTNIVIGIATTALLLSFVMLVYRKYGSADAGVMRRLKE